MVRSWTLARGDSLWAKPGRGHPEHWATLLLFRPAGCGALARSHRVTVRTRSNPFERHSTGEPQPAFSGQKRSGREQLPAPLPNLYSFSPPVSNARRGPHRPTRLASVITNVALLCKAWRCCKQAFFLQCRAPGGKHRPCAARLATRAQLLRRKWLTTTPRAGYFFGAGRVCYRGGRDRRHMVIRRPDKCVRRSLRSGAHLFGRIHRLLVVAALQCQPPRQALGLEHLHADLLRQVFVVE